MHRSLGWVSMLLLVLGTLFGVSPAHACSCVPLTLAEHIEDSAYVFRAYVTGAEIETNWLGKSTGRVVVSLKEIIPRKGGQPPPFDELYTPQDGPACGVKVAVAEFYWFFVGPDGRLSKCSPSGVTRLEKFKELEMGVIDEIWKYRRADRPQ